MKATFNKEALKDALSLITGVVPARSPKPVLECVKITVDNYSAEFFATDNEIGMTIEVNQVECECPGTIIIPAAKIASIVRESKDDTITIESSDMSIYVKGKSSKFTIYGYGDEQFPKAPGTDAEYCIKTTIGDLRIGVDSVMAATAKQVTHYGLQGVMWEVDEDSMRMVATDGKRLAMMKCGVSDVNTDLIPGNNIIVPSKTLNLLHKITAGSEREVLIKFADNQIVFDCGNVAIMSNLIDGKFPAYENIIPESYETQATLNCNDVMSAARSASLLTNDDSKGIKLSFTKNRLKLTGRAPEMGDAEINVDIEYDGPDNEIAFNPLFLIDAIKGCKHGDFIFEFTDKERPGVIKKGDDYIHVIMPMNA